MLIQASAYSIPLRDESVQCVVTSPPYWGLRDYGVDGQLGLEATPELYVEHMVEVFREVRRVLRPDGTLWLNLGDSYAAARSYQVTDTKWRDVGNTKGSTVPDGLKPKDLVGIPWRVAFALQADGWWLRSDIVWSKPNPMPESVTDRPTKSHEYVFLLSKSARYFYDAKAIEEPLSSASIKRLSQRTFDQQEGGPKDYGPNSNRSARRALVNLKGRAMPPQVGDAPERYAGMTGRNARSVWEIATQPYRGAHFATFPEELATRCILAGSGENDTVLDPFAGSGTTLQVARSLKRRGIGLDLNSEYLSLARMRVSAKTRREKANRGIDPSAPGAPRQEAMF